MRKKFDIIIAGSGPSAQALACSCASESLSVLLISPTLHERWVPNYASWLQDIEILGLYLIFIKINCIKIFKSFNEGSLLIGK